MCGFAGIISWDISRPVRDNELRDMGARIAHRGPDGHGIWIHHQSTGLIHHRLAILDPDPHANQPFHSPDGHLHIAFNGEIYNFRLLRNELRMLLPDFAWKTDCDTEVLLAAYIAWGEKCLDRLNGMFAFAIYDDRDQSLFLARDRMGQKPLYYAQASYAGLPGAIAFASELSALRRVRWIEHGNHLALSRESLTNYLLLGYIPGTHTIYQGVHRLAPGSFMRLRADRVERGSYFNAGRKFPAHEHRNPSLSASQQTRQLLDAAVARQLVSDVPIGCFLSGGIDSSIIAAAMRSAIPGNQSLHTFSIAFDDPRYDESPYAERVAAHLGTQHRTFRITPDVAADLPRLAQVYGEPFGDSSALPTHYLSRAVRDHVKVALSGDGGDELFAGYDRYRALLLTEKLRKRPYARRLFGSRLLQSLPGRHPKSKLARLKRLGASVNLPIEERYPSYVRLFDLTQVSALLGRPSLATDPRLIGDQWFNAYLDDREPLQAALAIDRVTYLPDDLLTKVDRASMLHALEVRSPFMDHELVAFASTLSTEELLAHGSKSPLRQAYANDLPAEVFNRPKMGFAIPIGEWFRTTLRPMLHEHLLAGDSFASSHLNVSYIKALLDAHQRKSADHTQRLYALLMLELWHRTMT